MSQLVDLVERRYIESGMTRAEARAMAGYYRFKLWEISTREGRTIELPRPEGRSLALLKRKR